MHTASFPLPTHILFTHETERDHQKLHVEPVITEPHKQINTQDYGKRPKPERIVPPS